MNYLNQEIPNNVEAEQSILGAILLDKDVINIASKKLKPYDFYNNVNRVIYESMIGLYNDSEPIDLITLSERLRITGQLEKIGISYLTSLSTVVPTILNAESYIDLVIEKRVRRNGIKQGIKFIESLYKSSMTNAIKELDEIKKNITEGDTIENMNINANDIKRSSNRGKYISTGFEAIDSILGGGIKSTTLTILTGEPGSGKSTIVNQMLASALADGNKCFIYSGELPASDLVFWFDRTVANEHHILEKVSKRGSKYIDISDYGWNSIGEWVKDRLFIFKDDARATKDNILSSIENLALKKGVNLFVIDNLMTLEPGKEEDRYLEQKKLCLELKELAKTYDLSIILLAHPKKPSNKESKPSMYDISGASEIVGSADTVIRIERPKNENEDSKIIILKNRWGGVIDKFVRVGFDVRRKRYYTNGSELKRDYGYEPNKQFSQAEIQSPF